MGSLKTVLGLGPREHVALVGAGGKTSLMFALAEELQGLGHRVVTSTTTKIWQHQASKYPGTILIGQHESWQEELRKVLRTKGHAFLGEKNLDTGKIQGVSPSLLDDVCHGVETDYLIIEADGSAGRPVKAHDRHEPVIPASTTLVVGMTGLEALGQPVGPETVFRQDIFNEVTGAKPGQIITGEILAGLFSAPEGIFKGTPDRARRAVFLNKTDLLAQSGPARELAVLVREKVSPPLDCIVYGSVTKGEYSALAPG